MAENIDDISVFPLALGTWTFAGDRIWGATDENQCIQVVHSALEMGIELFDTSPNYGEGRSEEILGKALVTRSEAQVATKIKIDGLSETDIRNLIYGSLKRLKRDRIDLMQIHWPGSNPDETQRALDVFAELKENSVVKNIGVCNFGIFDIAETADYPIISNQLPYGLLWRVIEREIAPAGKAKGLKILSYATLQQGLLSGKYKSLESFPEGRQRTRHFSAPAGSLYRLTDSTLQDLYEFAADRGMNLAKIALAFSLSREIIDTVIVGARTKEQLQQIFEAREVQLSVEDLKDLESITEPLKSKLGGNPDMFKEESRVRYSNENGDPVR